MQETISQLRLPIIHPRTVVILEDDTKLAARMKKLLGVFGFEPVHFVKREQVIEMVSRGEGISFVLDVQIKDEKIGLDILEEIKTRRPEAFVCIYSNYIDEEALLHRADRLHADLILTKSRVEKKDLYTIAQAILRHEHKLITCELQLILCELENLERGSPPILDWETGTINQTTAPPPKTAFSRREAKMTGADPNIAEYRRLSAQPQWYKEHAGKHVGIVNGALQTVNGDLAVLLAELRFRFPDEPRFVKLVELEDDTSLDVPTPFFID